MTKDLTLQINLSPGDVNYAMLTVPALVSRHKDIGKRLLVVDCCRPQKTKLMDPDSKYPLAIFNQNAERITDISEQLLKNKTVTDVYYLKPGDRLFKDLSKKYLNNTYSCTHSAGGTANMAYWAAIELPDTRYVLHYDGDMILYQKPGYFWHQEAAGLLEKDEHSLFAIPRPCPPVGAEYEWSSLHEGRPIGSYAGFWKNDWFSTRCFLVDKHKLAPFLPLVRGRLMMELMIRKYARRAFPLDPEIVVFRSLAPRGAERIILKSNDAWLLHPLSKPREYLDILPKIIGAVTIGDAPAEQHGYEDINLQAWQHHFEK